MSVSSADDNKTKSARNTKNRFWFGTLNNYNDDLYTTIKEWLDINAVSYVVGKEVGKQNNTPHLQFCMRFENCRSFNSLKKIFNWHIEMCNSWRDSVRYCMKEGEYIVKNIKEEDYADRPPARPGSDRPTDRPATLLPHEEEYENYMMSVYSEVKWYDWQQEIIDLVDNPPSNRKIHWYWEADGNKGKSFLVRYLDWKHNAIIANGKQGDVFNQYKTFLDEQKKQPKIAIIDIPRSHKDYICYSTLEKIKDGLIYSGKYEGGKCRLIPHHLIIFANFEPDKSTMSLDRWDIHNLC